MNFKITDIYAGKNHNIIYGQIRDPNAVLNKEGEEKTEENKGEIIFTWGDNSCGQLGLGTSVNKVDVPTEVTTFNGINTQADPKLNKEIASISGGANSSYVLFADGELYGFGDNKCKQISLENANFYNKPYLINYSFLKENNEQIADLLTAANSILAITDKNTMILQGLIAQGQIKTNKLNYFGCNRLSFRCNVNISY